jgi:hypothetical protein
MKSIMLRSPVESTWFFFVAQPNALKQTLMPDCLSPEASADILRNSRLRRFNAAGVWSHRLF